MARTLEDMGSVGGLVNAEVTNKGSQVQSVGAASTSDQHDQALSPGGDAAVTYLDGGYLEGLFCVHCGSREHSWFDCAGRCGHCGTKGHSATTEHLATRCNELGVSDYQEWVPLHQARLAQQGWNTHLIATSGEEDEERFTADERRMQSSEHQTLDEFVEHGRNIHVLCARGEVEKSVENALRNRKDKPRSSKQDEGETLGRAWPTELSLVNRPDVDWGTKGLHDYASGQHAALQNLRWDCSSNAVDRIPKALAKSPHTLEIIDRDIQGLGAVVALPVSFDQFQAQRSWEDKQKYGLRKDPRPYGPSSMPTHAASTQTTSSTVQRPHTASQRFQLNFSGIPTTSDYLRCIAKLRLASRSRASEPSIDTASAASSSLESASRETVQQAAQHNVPQAHKRQPLPTQDEIAPTREKRQKLTDSKIETAERAMGLREWYLKQLGLTRIFTWKLDPLPLLDAGYIFKLVKSDLLMDSNVAKSDWSRADTVLASASIKVYYAIVITFHESIFWVVWLGSRGGRGEDKLPEWYKRFCLQAIATNTMTINLSGGGLKRIGLGIELELPDDTLIYIDKLDKIDIERYGKYVDQLPPAETLKLYKSVKEQGALKVLNHNIDEHEAKLEQQIRDASVRAAAETPPALPPGLHPERQRAFQRASSYYTGFETPPVRPSDTLPQHAREGTEAYGSGQRPKLQNRTETLADFQQSNTMNRSGPDVDNDPMKEGSDTLLANQANEGMALSRDPRKRR